MSTWSTHVLRLQLNGSGAGTATTDVPLYGMLMDVKILVLQSDGVTASVNNVGVTIAEVVSGYSQTLFAATYTGVTNRVAPSVAYVNSSGVSTGLVRPPAIAGKISLSCGSGTANQFVIAILTVSA